MVQSRRTRAGWLTAGLFLLLTGPTAAAHDMWIEPTAFHAEADTVLGLRLRVGQDFLGDPLVRDPALIDKFVVADGKGVRRVVGRDGGDPAGLLRPVDPGLLVFGYQSKESPVVLPGGKFQQYLAEEGLEQIITLRSQRGETMSEAREVFIRCAKSLVLVGPAASAHRDQALHFILELTAEKNPYAMAAGESLPFLLSYRDQPLPGALVVAINQTRAAAKVSARTDKDGRVRLRLDTPGPWLIKAVHMTPAPSGSDSQWASFWASLTFDLPAATARTSR